MLANRPTILAEGRKVLRFATVGLGAAGLYYGLVFVLITLGLGKFSSSLIGYLLVIPLAYALQYHWTFASQRLHRSTLPRYAGMQVVIALGTASLVHVTPSGISEPWLVAAIAAGLASAISFLVSRFIIFEGRGAPHR